MLGVVVLQQCESRRLGNTSNASRENEAMLQIVLILKKVAKLDILF